jgi:hypothetical protein
MKFLLAITLLLTFFCVNPSFGQHTTPKHFTNNFFKTTASQTKVSSRNTPNKRLRGESSTINSLTDSFDDSGDSSQYFYDAYNRASERRNWTLDDGIWMLTSRTQFLSYDSAGNSLLEIFQLTPDAGATWENNARIAATYNNAGQNTATSIQYWSVLDNDWQVASLFEYEYDVDGNFIGSINGEYITNRLYTWNADGFPVILTDRYKNSLDSVWQYASQRHFVYDTIHPGEVVHETLSAFDDLTNNFYVTDSVLIRRWAASLSGACFKHLTTGTVLLSNVILLLVKRIPSLGNSKLLLIMPMT